MSISNTSIERVREQLEKLTLPGIHEEAKKYGI